MQILSRQISLGGAPLNDSEARHQLVWDIPVRLVHWLLVSLIAFSWWSVHAQHTSWHIWSGCAILALLIFRFLWGLVGSTTARFSSFVRGPRAIRNYLQGTWVGVGHSPLGALSVLALFAALAVQVGLGLIAEDDDGIFMGPLAVLVSSATSDKAREFHSFWFYIILALVGLHLLAIMYYRVRGHKLTSRMITGRAELEAEIEPVRPGKWWVALICLAVAIALTRWVIAGVPPFGP